MSKARFLLLSVTLSCCYPSLLQAQIEIWHGLPGTPDFYNCLVSGLKGMGSDCGTKYDEMVFTATILSIASVGEDRSRLTLRPETIFKGVPTLGMEILTAQQRCLPEIKIGDSWLFSLYRDKNSQEFIVNYGSRSGPEAEQREQIALLRRLDRLDAAGIVKGRAYLEAQQGEERPTPSVKHTILLKSIPDGRQHKAETDEKGDFSFAPLPAGRYDFEANTKQGLWTMWSGEIEVEPHSCTDFDLDFHVDGSIVGKLIFPEGVDPSSWQVEATPADDDRLVSASDWTDVAGHFELHGLSPGKYVVALKKTDMRDGPNLHVDLFAPGTPNRTNARVIVLGRASRATNVELVVPNSAMKR